MQYTGDCPHLLLAVSVVQDLVPLSDLGPMPHVVQGAEIDLRADEPLGPLLDGGCHHLLGPRDVLAAGQSPDLTSSYLLLVDVYGLGECMGIG